MLGSTGSVGRSTLDVLRRQRDHFAVVALTCGRNREEFERQVAEWRPAFAGLAVPGADDRWPCGPEVLVEAATRPDVDIVVNAVVGAAGLDATLAALRAGKRVALANKESLVMAGDLVVQAACTGGGRDRAGGLGAQRGAPVRRGARRRAGPADPHLFRRAVPGMAARADPGGDGGGSAPPPTWRMGQKITVDSATLANKALEVIEAHYLFRLSYDALEVVVHPQSIIHAFVEFCDGSVIAQLGFPSMELPILYALTHPGRLPDTGVRRLDPVAAGPLTFEPVRRDVFRALDAGMAAGRAAGTAPAVFNAANEVAVAAFLDGAVPFGRISEIIERVLDAHAPAPATAVEAVREADRWARARARELVRTPC